MNPTVARYVHGTLAFLSGGSLVVAQFYPQFATVAHLVGGLAITATVSYAFAFVGSSSSSSDTTSTG